MKTSRKDDLFVLEYKNGFIVQVKSFEGIIQEAIYSGRIPRVDIWKKCPVVWLWLLENEVFNSRKISILKKSNPTALTTSIKKAKSFSLASADRFESSNDFILSFIDKLELELFTENDTLLPDDYIKLSILETLCHKKKMNLYNFFLHLENDMPLEADKKFKPISTSAGLCHKAIAIVANAKGITYTEISKRTGIDRSNLLSDKSDSLRGKRKTIETRTLFMISQVLEISLSALFVLCHMILESDIYEAFMREDDY